MKTQVNCHTCRYSDWGYKYKPEELNPCKICIGYHKWAARRPNDPNKQKPLKSNGKEAKADAKK